VTEPVRSHRELAAGQWCKLSRVGQLDPTLEDPRGRNRLSEIARARELLCAVTLLGGREYGTSLEDLDGYFLAFAAAARNARSHGLA